MSRGPDVATMLLRALDASARHGHCPVTIVESDWTHWASATFTGARHAIMLSAAPSAALDRWLTALPEADFVVRGHLVADLVIASVQRTPDAVMVGLEALTVAE